MANINVDTLLTSAGGRNLAERILDKEFLKRVEIKGALYAKTKAYGLSKPMPTKEGVYFRFSRKQNIRQPSTDPMTSEMSSDPLSGITLGMDQVLLPIESHREYADIDVLTPLISWVDVENWAKDDMARIAWPRRANRLLQNALLNGRMAPGVYAANGTISTPFDRTAAATLTRWGLTFTFTSFPRAYAQGVATFADVKPDTYLKWADIGRANVELSNSGAPMIDGSSGPGYVCVLSRAQWYDLQMDDDGGKLTALIQSGANKAVIEGLIGMAVYFYKDTYFVIETDPYTLNAGNEVARAEWGKYHVAFMFGQDAYGYTSLGSTKFGNFKVTDTTKTGAQYSIGARIHWNCRVVNENWGKTLISAVRIDKPNNYSPTNKQLQGFLVE